MKEEDRKGSRKEREVNTSREETRYGVRERGMVVY